MRIYIRVVPRSSKVSIELVTEHEYRVRLTAPPVEGKANEQLVSVLSEYFGVAKSLISIVGGKSARVKIVDIG